MSTLLMESAKHLREDVPLADVVANIESLEVEVNEHYDAITNLDDHTQELNFIIDTIDSGELTKRTSLILDKLANRTFAEFEGDDATLKSVTSFDSFVDMDTESSITYGVESLSKRIKDGAKAVKKLFVKMIDVVYNFFKQHLTFLGMVDKKITKLIKNLKSVKGYAAAPEGHYKVPNSDAIHFSVNGSPTDDYSFEMKRLAEFVRRGVLSTEARKADILDFTSKLDKGFKTKLVFNVEAVKSMLSLFTTTSKSWVLKNQIEIDETSFSFKFTVPSALKSTPWLASDFVLGNQAIVAPAVNEPILNKITENIPVGSPQYVEITKVCTGKHIVFKPDLKDLEVKYVNSDDLIDHVESMGIISKDLMKSSLTTMGRVREFKDTFKKAEEDLLEWASSDISTSTFLASAIVLMMKQQIVTPLREQMGLITKINSHARKTLTAHAKYISENAKLLNVSDENLVVDKTPPKALPQL